MLCSAQPCFYSEPTIIQAEDSISISIDVSGLIADDLSVDQSICGVRLFFSHGQIENVRMTLTSPTGQSVVLVGPGTLSSGLTSFIDWNITFTQCTSASAPDLGFSDQWNNDQAWASFTPYDGIYYPNNGCLEDFNLGSANGVWTLDIENLGPIDGTIEFFEIIFCDPSGSICDPCFLDAGDIQEEFFTTCQQDVRLRNLEQFLNADFIIDPITQDYRYVLISGDDIIGFEETILQSDTLPPDTYTICGIAYELSDFDQIAEQTEFSTLQNFIGDGSFCGDITSPCFTLVINGVDNLLELDTTLCRGDTLSYLGIKIFDNLDTNILRTNQVTCDSLISISALVVEPVAVIEAPDLVTTCGESLFLNASSSTTNGQDIAYNWSTVNGTYVNDIGPIASVDTSGYYLLEVESNGCTDTVGIFISSIDSFDLDYTIDPIFCLGDTFFVELTTNVDNLSVDGPSTIDVDLNGFSTLDEGTYFIESQLGRCTKIDTLILIDEATIIDIQVSSSVIDCDSILSRTIVTTNATNPIFNYEGQQLILDTTANINISNPGLYSVTVTDEMGCTAVSAFIVEGSSDLPVFNTEDLLINCTDQNPVLPLEIMSAIDSVLWLGPNSFESREINPIAIDTGEYMITVFAAGGCSITRSIMFSINNVSPLFSLIGDTITCLQDTIMLCVDDLDLDVEWIYNNTIVSTEDCLMTSESGLYMVNVMDMNGCTGSGTYDLIDLSLLGFSISNLPDSLTLTCIDTIANLEPVIDNSGSQYLYNWYNESGFLSEDSVFTADQAGNYFLEVTDSATGCSSIDSVFISELSSLINSDNIIIIADNIACDGDSANISIIGIDLDIIELYINQELVSNPLSIMLVEGEYDFLFVDSLGCSTTIPQSVISDVPFTLDLGPDITASIGDQIDLDVAVNVPLSQITSFLWSDTTIIDCNFCIDPIITVSQDQILSLILEDINGCNQSDSIRINVVNSSNLDNIYFPNVFRPSGVGDDRFWTVYLPDGNVKVLELRIYDRWGNLVTFRSNSSGISDMSWNGSYDGKDAEEGVYVYVVKYLDNTNRESLAKGQITLLR